MKFKTIFKHSQKSNKTLMNEIEFIADKSELEVSIMNLEIDRMVFYTMDKDSALKLAESINEHYK